MTTFLIISLISLILSLDKYSKRGINLINSLSFLSECHVCIGKPLS